MRRSFYTRKATVEQKHEMVVRYLANEPISSIARQYSLDRKSVKNILRLRCDFVPKPPPNKLSEEDKFQVVRLYKLGLSSLDLADRFRVSKASILELLARRKVKCRDPYVYIIPSHVQDWILEVYTQEWLSLKEIAHLAHLAPLTVSQFLKEKLGQLRTFRHRHHRLNDSVFDDPLTPEAKYWIGMLMADGCIYRYKETQQSRIVLTLAVVDKAHVEKLRDFLQCDYPLVWTPPYIIKDTGYWSSGAWTVSVTSEHLANRLANFGIVPRKSKTAKFALGLERDSNVLRGLIDGDGSLNWYTKYTSKTTNQHQSIYLQCVGDSRTLMDQVLSVFKTLVSTKVNLYHHVPRNSFSFRITDDFAYVLIKWLYENAVVALDRKNLIAQDIIRNYVN